MDIGQLGNPNERDEDVNAVQRHQRQRTQKSRWKSDNERKTSHSQAAVPTPPTPCQPNPRDRKPGNEDKTECAQEETARVAEVWRQRPSCQAVSIR